MSGNSIEDGARADTTAEKTPVKNFLEGGGLLQDSVGGVEAIISGDWAGGLADIGAGALDIADVVKDPFSTILSMGFGWLIEHIGPIKQVLDWLTGNQQALELTVKTWEQISKQVQTTAEQLADSFKGNCASWTGKAADDYRTWAQDQLDAYVALSNSARGAGAAVDFCKNILNAVRGFVRGLIADTLAKLVSILCRYLPPAWLLAIAAEGAPMIANNTMKATKMVRRMLDAFGRLGKHLGKLGELLSRVTKHLSRGAHAVDMVARHRMDKIAEQFTRSQLLERAGTELLKEGVIKYGGSRVLSASTAAMTSSTNPDAQIDLGETRAKQKEDWARTRITDAKTGVTRITGDLEDPG